MKRIYNHNCRQTSFIEKNPGFVITVLCAWLYLVLSFSSTALAQSDGQYELSWFTIDGGGGKSSGGQYILTGTIGQPDAAYSAGGDYEVLGGFWPGGPLCFVDFEDFARFAQYWFLTGSDMPADLYEDNIVDYNDLRLFVDEWLNYCPYNWPLR